jgi:hypothetical protein
MSTASQVAIVIAVAAVAFVVFIVWRENRSTRLRRRFGPEYDRVRQRHGSRMAAERELAARERRVEELDVRPLDPAARDRYRAEWQRVQEEFVDHPQPAVGRADQLVTTVMAERGYPSHDADERTASLSVNHARTLDHYRRGRAISTRARKGWISTEELRQAMVHYRALFDDLLDLPKNGSREPASARRYVRDAGPAREPALGHDQEPAPGQETAYGRGGEPAPAPEPEPEPEPEPAYGHGRRSARRNG